MDYTVNAERGEVLILLGGKAYPMRPSYNAMVAIEAKLGSIVALSYRHANPLQGLGIKEMAIIICEAVKAAGSERQDSMLLGFSETRVGEFIAADGHLSVLEQVQNLLLNMITGGAAPKKKDDPPSRSTQSPIAP